jgi:uncharacterized protein YpuA (DUF1002 family)
MPCNQQRILELEREEEEDRKRKKRLQEEKERQRKQEELRQKAREAIRVKAKQFQWRLTEVKKDVFVAFKPYSDDRITFTVKEGGIIKTVTDEISMANHENAELFLKDIAKFMRGKWNIFHRHGGGEFHSHARHHH